MSNRHSQFYLDYLQSAAWQARRQRAIQRAHCCCERCGNTRTLQVHHKTYERLGYEWPGDLEVLCADCHPYADNERRIESWAKKRFGDDWGDQYLFDEIEEMFQDWLDQQIDFEVMRCH